MRQKNTSSVQGLDEAPPSDPLPREPSLGDWGHMWHPDNFGTQFRNGTITFAVNGLSLAKDWFDFKNLPHGALDKAGSLLEPKDWPKLPNKTVLVYPAQSSTQTPLLPDPLNLAEDPPLCTRDHKGKGKLDNHIPREDPPKKKARVSISHARSGQGRPLRLSNRGNRGSEVKGTKGRGGGGGRGANKLKPRGLDQLCEVVVSPTKELAEAEQKRVTSNSNRETAQRKAAVSKILSSGADYSAGGGGWPTTATRPS